MLVAYQLIARDMRVVVLRRLPDDLINTGITVFFFNFVFGSLGPMVGIDPKLVASTFLGTVIGSMFFVGFSRAITDLADRKFFYFIDYRRTLPLTNRWFLSAQVTSYALHFLCATLPILVFGKLMLGARLNLADARWLAFIGIYSGVMLLIATFFSCLVYAVSFEWFKSNIWQRVLTPTHLLGCLFYPWSKAYAFSPLFASVLLCNPMTYCVEGLRSSLLGGGHFIPAWVCLMVVWFFSCVAIWLLLTILLRRLDWVRGSS